MHYSQLALAVHRGAHRMQDSRAEILGSTHGIAVQYLGPVVRVT